VTAGLTSRARASRKEKWPAAAIGRRTSTVEPRSVPRAV
jgi:hypothetical protein